MSTFLEVNMSPQKSIGLLVARKGSQRLTNKNKKKLLGKPLFQWTLDAALASSELDEIWVSSDDEDILELSAKNDRVKTDKRPADLCGSQVKSADVLKYMITKAQKKPLRFDFFCLLQPTSPFRGPEIIDQVMKILKSKQHDFVLGVKQFNTPIHFALDNTKGLQPVYNSFLTKITRTQETPHYYHPAGGIYAGKIDSFLSSGHFYGPHSYGFLLDDISAWDINTIDDFKIAEIFAHHVCQNEIGNSQYQNVNMAM